MNIVAFNSSEPGLQEDLGPSTNFSSQSYNTCKASEALFSLDQLNNAGLCLARLNGILIEYFL